MCTFQCCLKYSLINQFKALLQCYSLYNISCNLYSLCNNFYFMNSLAKKQLFTKVLEQLTIPPYLSKISKNYIVIFCFSLEVCSMVAASLFCDFVYLHMIALKGGYSLATKLQLTLNRSYEKLKLNKILRTLSP